ncbi:allantoate amidohydrolase [Egibacter rhizosphaerae]|uniref:Allantoate amidohydrolase n=1 Tax=Egibacter rhizosphaerae TaxID=1670831 RepID=A0A411YAU8_9ACTN|nr:allantoate amidohydrolase [Egibacter rhizosphaerae]QBI18316.1 allantoate amidohydrolase [Egibacter rhizosphaerae]
MNVERDPHAAFAARFDPLADIGRDPVTGGYHRFAWTDADAAAAGWFDRQADDLGLEVEIDRNGNRWAWWWPDDRRLNDLAPGAAVVTGSHLDTVPDGGAFDGALGVVSGFSAVEALRADGFTPSRPLAVGAFADEEGARYDTPCFGSGLAAGTLAPDSVLERRDRDGIRLADALAAAGVDPDAIGPDPDRLRRVGAFVELHVEQGRGLVFADQPVGIGTGIRPHGRWAFTLSGETNHAGTTRMADRRDPMGTLAALIGAAGREALARDAVATVGRVEVHPGGTNAVPGRVRAWLDARAQDDATVEALLEAVTATTSASAEATGVSCERRREAYAPGVVFDPALRSRLDGILRAAEWGPVSLSTAAGHDAGALAAAIPTGMLYIRNREGISHSPGEHADADDCVEGVRALAAVLRELAA